MIQYIAEEVEMIEFDQSVINRWIKSIAAQYNRRPANISYIFCSDERILEVNKQYLQHDYYTDIITFDYSRGNTISGDIFISLDTVADNANQLGVEFRDELCRILIHGILHLCGQDDKTPEMRAEMTDKENKALERLRKDYH
ncbi:MAG TPA: rRNA maturation RNase YbeY [Paludibacteraceae bacterium]|nr:rRNA maturation RNase YbeY [Paludibacteraceae bacterium]HPT43893.1 rRNA maturation RNase YbeY [Paludibacteraceae bacterium]